MTQKPTIEVLKKRIAELEKAELEHKRTEKVLRQNEEKYRRLFELESDALFLIDNESGRILDANIYMAAEVKRKYCPLRIGF